MFSKSQYLLPVIWMHLIDTFNLPSVIWIWDCQDVSITQSSLKQNNEVINVDGKCNQKSLLKDHKNLSSKNRICENFSHFKCWF